MAYPGLEALRGGENFLQGGALSFISFILLCLLYVDILFSFKRKTSWVPGRWLLLGSFTLTLLQLNANTVPNAGNDIDRLLEMNRVSDYVDYFDGNILIQSRVVFCLVLCFVIPQVANDRGWNLFVDMVSLLLNACITITKMVYEILMINRYRSAGVCDLIERSADGCYCVCYGEDCNSSYLGYFEGRNVMLIVCTVIMCWCLCSAIFASISLRDTLNWSLSMFSNGYGKKQVANLRESTTPEFTEPQINEKLVEVCLMSRACQPGYIIARSPLSSSVFLIASFCCVLVILDLRKAYIRSMYKDYSFSEERSSFDIYTFLGYLDYLAYLFVPLQAILVFSLWMVIFWRWLTCVYYHSACACDSFGTRSRFKCGLKNVFHIEEFWVQSLLNFQVDKIISSEPEFSHLKLLQRIIIRMKLYKVVSLLVYFQKLTILCSKVLWFLASLFVALLRRIILLIFFQKLAILCSKVRWFLASVFVTLLGRIIPSQPEEATTVNERDVLRVGQSRVISMRDFQKIHKTLLFMQCQNPNGVWAENLSWMRCLNDQLQKEIKRGSECMELKWLLAHSQTDPPKSASLVSKYLSRGNLNDSDNFYMGYSSIKITIASLLTVMVELSHVFEHYFSTAVTLPGANISLVETYKKGCTQAWEVVGLAESLVKKPHIVGRAGDTLFKQLLQKSKANCTGFHDADFFSLIKNGVEDLKRVRRDAFVREVNSSSDLE